MKLIHFQGMNCYHDCIISIANDFGLNYSAAFATLWSETNFRYDSYRKVYLTKRLISNLEVIGAKVECFDCFSSEDVLKHLALFQDGEFMIVGMDAFYIPWSQFYQTLHGIHYFIAQNAKTETLLCFDPTYNKENEKITLGEIIAHTFDIGHIRHVVKNPLEIEITDEAQKILLIHPNIRQKMLSQIHNCVREESEHIILLAKYVDAMISNRYLYQFFLRNHSISYKWNTLFLHNDYFSKWNAVKNGLYKASINRNDKDTIDAVCDHFNYLIDVELSIAEKIMHEFKLRD